MTLKDMIGSALDPNADLGLPNHTKCGACHGTGSCSAPHLKPMSYACPDCDGRGYVADEPEDGQ